MRLPDRARHMINQGRQLVMSRGAEPDPEDRAAWRAAVDLWNEVFQPFSPLIDDADVLDLGCGDGRMAGALAGTGGARSVFGVGASAGWHGAGGFAPWQPNIIPRLELHEGMERLESLDPGTFDLVLCRDFDGTFPLTGIEDLLTRLYALLRPGGEAIFRLGCAGPAPERGYGFMTPTAWVALLTRAGFEIAGQRRVWCETAQQDLAVKRLPRASDDERLTVETRVHLLRPWESWELDALREFGDQRRGLTPR